jgi:hypothetical protein
VLCSTGVDTCWAGRGKARDKEIRENQCNQRLKLKGQNYGRSKKTIDGLMRTRDGGACVLFDFAAAYDYHRKTYYRPAAVPSPDNGPVDYQFNH